MKIFDHQKKMVDMGDKLTIIILMVKIRSVAKTLREAFFISHF